MPDLPNYRTILFATDGSEYAALAEDHALALARQAGARIEAVFVVDRRMATQLVALSSTMLEELKRDGQQALDRLVQRAHEASIDVGTNLAEGHVGPTILSEAARLGADMIVVGSHGRTALGRMILGSVSQRVINEAHCSVRVARGRIVEPDVPERIIVGVDGSAGSEAAVREVSSRNWAPGSEVRIVNSMWTIPPVGDPGMAVELAEWIAMETERAQKAVDSAAEKLSSVGLKVLTIMREQEPKLLLCSEAESMRADCIFVGARGTGRHKRFLIGGVSSGVAARAHCSVEVAKI